MVKDLVSFEVESDNNDVEGYRFVDSAGNTDTVNTSGSGNTWQGADNLDGSLIGFTVDIGSGGESPTYPDQIVYISAIYSRCSCPTALWNAYSLASSATTVYMQSGSDFTMNLAAPTNTVTSVWQS